MVSLFRRVAAAAVLILFPAFIAPAVQAGPAEMDLLTSYVGNWAGSSTLRGAQSAEDFRCRLTISKGNQAKINYAGRCTLENMNLSVTGTILFDDKSQRYQAVMGSNVGFDGQAVGKRNGDKINFTLAEEQIDRGGNQIRVGAAIELSDGTVVIDFEVEFNNSGDVLTATVPFSKS
jgi:hypothetical protein